MGFINPALEDRPGGGAGELLGNITCISRSLGLCFGISIQTLPIPTALAFPFYNVFWMMQSSGIRRGMRAIVTPNLPRWHQG